MAVHFNTTVASFTLAGSVLSCVSTTCVLLSFIIYRHQLSNFRHILVLNLTIAGRHLLSHCYSPFSRFELMVLLIEFVNSLNNSVSGIIYVRTRQDLQDGSACAVNGLIGQLSVQAADFSILAIALITLLTVTRMTYMPSASGTKRTAICLAVWTIPLITSVTATAMGEMTSVGGNWCWISGSRSDLRYALGHGWRFTTIFSTIIIYIYIWLYLRKHLVAQRSADTSS